MKRFIGPLLALVAVALICGMLLTAQRGKQQVFTSATLIAEVQYDVGIAHFAMIDTTSKLTGSPYAKKAMGDKVTFTAQATANGQQGYRVLKEPTLASALSLADAQDCDVGLYLTRTMEKAQAGTAWPTSALVNDPVKMLNALA